MSGDERLGTRGEAWAFFITCGLWALARLVGVADMLRDLSGKWLRLGAKVASWVAFIYSGWANVLEPWQVFALVVALEMAWLVCFCQEVWGGLAELANKRDAKEAAGSIVVNCPQRQTVNGPSGNLHTIDVTMHGVCFESYAEKPVLLKLELLCSLTPDVPIRVTLPHEPVEWDKGLRLLRVRPGEVKAHSIIARIPNELPRGQHQHEWERKLKKEYTEATYRLRVTPEKHFQSSDPVEVPMCDSATVRLQPFKP